jgi:hypothetical protein
MTASLCGGATWDTYLRVFCGTCDALNCVDYDDDGCGTLQSEVIFCSEIYCDYWILIGGFSTASGPFTLNVSDDGVPCTPTTTCGPCEPPITDCDPIVDLTVIKDVANTEYDLHWTVIQETTHKLYYTNNPNHDGDPDEGADPDFAVIDLGILPVGPASYATPDTTVNLKYWNFVIAAEGCGPAIPEGRCCYGDVMAPSCAVETNAACTARTDEHSWTYGLDCTTDCPLPSYCAASHSTCDEYISNVTVGTINNTTDCTTGGYNDYTAISTNMTAETGYPITVTNPVPYSTDATSVWIDWNNDFTFGAGEQVDLTSDGTGASFTGTITPPAGSSGTHRMRIRIGYSWTPVACGATSYGETEDYTVIVP